MGTLMNALFELDAPETELVNIANETPTGLLVTERVHLWCAQSERNYYIGRGTWAGNPYSHLPRSAAKFTVSTREESVMRYRPYILAQPHLLERLEELRGKRLGCWCVPKLCHGSVLIELLCKETSNEIRLEDI